MKSRDASLDSRVMTLLGDPQYAGHPVREALADLHAHLGAQVSRIERITALSDAFQAMARERQLSLVDRFDRQLRRLSKIVTISDRYQEVLRDHNVAVTDASNRDPLTDMFNRRALADRLRKYCDESVCSKMGFALVMLDVDHFKLINDHYGHEVGDRTLVALGGVMTMELGAQDFCGRWGGEEFLIALCEPDAAEACRQAEHILEAVRNMQVPVGGGALSLTCSMGLAMHEPGEAISLTLNRADIALYDAKQNGRNRLAVERSA